MNIFKIIRGAIYIMEGYMKWLYDAVRHRMSFRSLRRWTICKECEHNYHGVCAECGCVLKAKVRVDYDLDEDGISIDGCPMRKW